MRKRGSANAEIGAVAIQGPRNLTVVGVFRTLTDEALEGLAQAVSQKNPKRRYYIVNQRREKLYRWHVGEGFSHAEGWWVNV